MVSNKQRLGDTLAGRMAQTAGASVPTTVELGVINANLSLTTDSIKTPIPKDQYMVDIRLAGSSYQITGGSHTHSGGEHAQETGTGAHTHTGGEHTHSLVGSESSAVSAAMDHIGGTCGQGKIGSSGSFIT